MAFTQDFRTQRRNYNDGETRIGEKDRLWYDSATNSIRVGDGETPGGVIVGGSGGGSDYVLPTASSTTKGGVKIGSNITITDGVISVAAPFSGSYNDLTSKPTLFSGSYTDLTNKPTLFDGAYASLTGKPTLFSGSYDDLTNKPTIPSLTGYATESFVTSRGYLTSIGTGTITNAMLEGNIANAKLLNSRVTIGSTVVALGTTTANLEGLNSVTATNFIGNATTVTNGVYTNSIGAVTDIMLAGNIANNKLANSSITVNGTSISLGSSATITAANPNALTIGTGLSGTSYTGGSAVTIALATGYGDTQNPYASKTANYVLAAPNGSAGAPTFRTIVAADIPTLNQNTTGSAATLTTARNINGVSFNGSADITVTAAAGTLTGTELNSTVVTSSLTSVGTLTNLTVTNTIAGSINGSVLWTNSSPAPGTPYQTNISANSGNATITLRSGLPNLGSSVSWTFDDTKLTFPDTTTQTTAYTATAVKGLFSVTTNSASGAGSLSYSNGVFTFASAAGITVNGTAISLGGTATVTAAAGTLTGNTLASGVTASSLTSVGTLAGLRTTGLNNFGSDTFTKAGYATGDITLDNGSTDTPGLLMYYANNTNFALDSWNGQFSVLSGQLLRFVYNLNESGGAVKAAIDTTGNLATAGFVQPGSYRAGQVIKDTMLNNSEFTVNNTTLATTTSDTTLLTYSYTPASSSSYLIIHVHVADYRAASDTGGAGTDSYFSRIKVDDAEIVYSRQMTRSGEGFRTGSLFPLTGRYTNSNTTAKTITVGVRRDSADDSITVTNSATALTLRITEIAR
jgi:hypothetical protein